MAYDQADIWRYWLGDRWYSATSIVRVNILKLQADELIQTTFVVLLNHVLNQSPWARRRFEPFAGKHVSLAVGPFCIRFLIKDDGRVAEGTSKATPSVAISYPLNGLASILSRENATRGLQITGDAELAESVGFVLRNLRWDAEEDLAMLVGDIGAHRASRLFQTVIGEAQRTASNATNNVREFLTEERPVLVTEAHKVTFSDELRLLRDAIGRIEKRLNRCEKRLNSKSY